VWPDPRDLRKGLKGLADITLKKAGSFGRYYEDLGEAWVRYV